MKLETAIAEYVEHIRHERRLAKTTCMHYASWLLGQILLCSNPSPPQVQTINASEQTRRNQNRY